MPKSKRARVVHLTKVDKKGKELSLKLFANVRESLDSYQHCFVFSVDNMRNTYLKDVRNELSDCRYVLCYCFGRFGDSRDVVVLEMIDMI